MARRKKVPKAIKVMPDFSSTGIWDNTKKGLMIEYEDLRIPPALKLLFIDWIELFEECWDIGYSRMDANKAKKLNKRGLELAKMLKKLFPESKVTYVGELPDRLIKEVEV